MKTAAGEVAEAIASVFRLLIGCALAAIILYGCYCLMTFQGHLNR